LILKTIMVGTAFLGFVGCKTVHNDASLVQSQTTSIVQCAPLTGFHGTCQVTGVTGRQDTSTETARGSVFGGITGLRVTVPGPGGTGQTQVRFDGKSGPLDDLLVDQALDLYSRKGCIAEISGGVFGEGYSRRLTLRLLLNLLDEGQSGYAEVADYRNGKPIYATLALRCEWRG